VIGNGQIEMTLPAAEKSPARTIKSDTLDASGDATGALKNAQFSHHVTFLEENGKDGRRSANSDVLVLEMNDTAVASALFTGTATFTDDDLSAHAAEARYEPSEGMLRLRGRDKRGDPGVADARVTVDAESIDIGLESRRIGARNKVKSSLLARKDGGKRGAAAGDKDGHLPGLLQQDSAVSITADELAYDGDSGRALYTGRAWLSQGDTDIRAQMIDIQQQAGDLTATGGVRSTLVFDSGRSSGDADVLRYMDAERTVTYTAPTRAGSAAPVLAHVTGPQGDLRAQRIIVYLAREESRLERLVAEDDVLASIEKRTVRGARLVHTAKDDTYKVTASRSTPAIVEEGCRETKTPPGGGTLTFSKSTDSMDIKGEGSRTQTARKPSCQ
jgi:lipopolysaccharide export system protein LptA